MASAGIMIQRRGQSERAKRARRAPTWKEGRSTCKPVECRGGGEKGWGAQEVYREGRKWSASARRTFLADVPCAAFSGKDNGIPDDRISNSMMFQLAFLWKVLEEDGWTGMDPGGSSDLRHLWSCLLQKYSSKLSSQVGNLVKVPNSFFLPPVLSEFPRVLEDFQKANRSLMLVTLGPARHLGKSETALHFPSCLHVYVSLLQSDAQALSLHRMKVPSAIQECVNHNDISYHHRLQWDSGPDERAVLYLVEGPSGKLIILFIYVGGTVKGIFGRAPSCPATAPIHSERRVVRLSPKCGAKGPSKIVRKTDNHKIDILLVYCDNRGTQTARSEVLLLSMDNHKIDILLVYCDNRGTQTARSEVLLLSKDNHKIDILLVYCDNRGTQTARSEVLPLSMDNHKIDILLLYCDNRGTQTARSEVLPLSMDNHKIDILLVYCDNRGTQTARSEVLLLSMDNHKIDILLVYCDNRGTQTARSEVLLLSKGNHKIDILLLYCDNRGTQTARSEVLPLSMDNHKIDILLVYCDNRGTQTARSEVLLLSMDNHKIDILLVYCDNRGTQTARSEVLLLSKDNHKIDILLVYCDNRGTQTARSEVLLLSKDNHKIDILLVYCDNRETQTARSEVLLLSKDNHKLD
ncbi:hypothetical protein J6590_043748 [Homalodisca vitripennis]|nr:hypothetical protein J6590_043748 [Homalodisca vitripennis]